MTTAPATPLAGGGLSYREVGATRLGPLPDGYHHLHHRTRIGSGRKVFDAAGAALTTWRLHRGTGLRVRAARAWADPGSVVAVGVGLGPLTVTVPCAVVWAQYERDRTGFAYGTLPGHPESGEESFVVEMREDGSVWFTVMAFSRPDRWYTHAGGPAVPVFQHWYAKRLGRTLRRMAAGA
jgi:uncharacterized protein (UPF0548 family)